MSEYVPAEGDRVRVVLEGEVTPLLIGANRASFWLGSCQDNLINPDLEHVISVEKVTPPLPTRPGSVVRRLPIAGAPRSGYHLILRSDGMWYSGRGTWDASEIEQLPTEVIFDAGAS